MYFILCEKSSKFFLTFVILFLYFSLENWVEKERKGYVQQKKRASGDGNEKLMEPELGEDDEFQDDQYGKKLGIVISTDIKYFSTVKPLNNGYIDTLCVVL